MGFFEKFSLGKKKERRLGELGEKKKMIKEHEFLTGIDAAKVTVEKLKEMKRIADELKATENTKGEYVESEYDVKKKELAQHIEKECSEPKQVGEGYCSGRACGRWTFNYEPR